MSERCPKCNGKGVRQRDMYMDNKRNYKCKRCKHKWGVDDDITNNLINNSDCKIYYRSNRSK
jgi:hypothetical protein